MPARMGDLYESRVVVRSFHLNRLMISLCQNCKSTDAYFLPTRSNGRRFRGAQLHFRGSSVLRQEIARASAAYTSLNSAPNAARCISTAMARPQHLSLPRARSVIPAITTKIVLDTIATSLATIHIHRQGLHLPIYTRTAAISAIIAFNAPTLPTHQPIVLSYLLSIVLQPLHPLPPTTFRKTHPSI